MINVIIDNFVCTELYISLDQPSCILENLIVYSTVGFSICYIALEIVWHFGACRIHNKRIQPCMFKKVKTIPVQNTERKKDLSR